jgi:hypothetical protein
LKASVTEYEYEPVPGLPEKLPSDEEILWQGKPCWQTLARRAFHTRKVVGYFLLLWVVNVAWAVHGGRSLAPTLASSLMLVIPALIVLGLLSLLAWAIARSSLYTITNHRVVLRSGVAIPLTINLPFAQIAGAALREYGDGQGDIPLILTQATRVPYFALWPHARPWHYVPAQPMLRAIPDVSAVAKILAGALQRAVEQAHPPEAPEPAGAGSTQLGAGVL